MSKPVASIWIAMVRNFFSFFFESYNGRSMRLKQVCALGKTDTVSGIELIVNLRILLSFPWSARKPCAGTYVHQVFSQSRESLTLDSTPEVPVTNWRSRALCSSSKSSTTTCSNRSGWISFYFVFLAQWWMVPPRTTWPLYVTNLCAHNHRCTYAYIMNLLSSSPLRHFFLLCISFPILNVNFRESTQ